MYRGGAGRGGARGAARLLFGQERGGRQCPRRGSHRAGERGRAAGLRPPGSSGGPGRPGRGRGTPGVPGWGAPGPGSAGAGRAPPCRAGEPPRSGLGGTRCPGRASRVGGAAAARRPGQGSPQAAEPDAAREPGSSRVGPGRAGRLSPAEPRPARIRSGGSPGSVVRLSRFPARRRRSEFASCDPRPRAPVRGGDGFGLGPGPGPARGRGSAGEALARRSPRWPRGSCAKRGCSVPRPPCRESCRPGRTGGRRVPVGCPEPSAAFGESSPRLLGGGGGLALGPRFVRRWGGVSRLSPPLPVDTRTG